MGRSLLLNISVFFSNNTKEATSIYVWKLEIYFLIEDII